MFKFTGKDLMRQILKRTTASKDPTRVHLNSVLFKQTDRKATIVSTDGHRLTVLNFDQKHSKSILDGCISLPRKTNVPMSLLTIPSHEIAIEDNTLTTNFGKVELNQVDFPEYERVIPNRYDFSFVARRDVMLKEINNLKKRVKKIEYNAVYFEVIRDLDVFTLRLSCKSEDTEDDNVYASEPMYISVNDDTKETRIGFDIRYLHELCKNSSSYTFDVSMNEATLSLSPVQFESTENLSKNKQNPIKATMITILMPMRIE